MADTKKEQLVCHWSGAEAVGLSLLQNALFGGSYVPPEDTDYAAVLEFAWRHKIHGTLSDGVSHLPEDTVPAPVMVAWQKRTVELLRHNAKIAAQQKELCADAAEIGIRLVILKGATVARYYPVPELRASGDIDCLVSPDHLQAVADHLKSKGFAQIPAAPRSPHLCFVKDGVHIELHYAPAALPHGKAGEVLAAHLRDTVRDAATVSAQGQSFLAPSPAHQALILLLHMQEHMKIGGLGLRQVGDYALFLAHEMTPALAAELHPVLARSGLLRFAACLHRALMRHLGVPADRAPWADTADTALADALMADFVRSGNFGQGAPEYEGSISATSARKKGQGALGATLGGVAEKCRQEWPAARKCPPLLAFLMPYWVLRRQCRRDRIKIRPVRMLRASRRRVKLYDALGFFETEDEA